jgi:hypothetical protein
VLIFREYQKRVSKGKAKKEKEDDVPHYDPVAFHRLVRYHDMRMVLNSGTL